MPTFSWTRKVLRADRSNRNASRLRSQQAIRRAVMNRTEIESMEPRRLLSSTIRVVAYNIEDDINGNTTPLPGLYQVLEGIGEEKVEGNVRPIDILGLEETTSNADVQPIVTALNSYYGSADVYAESSYQATQDGGATDGNGPNALVYNTSTLKLLASVGIVTPEGETNGVYRQPVRYEFQPVGDTGTTGVFYVYVAHTKSGTTSADATDRGEEATIIRNDEATLPSTASVIYEGDLNANAPEAEFTNFEKTGQGEAYDPFSYATSPTTAELSDSATSLKYRDDYQLQTSNVFNDTGAINYVSGSFHNFANNGSVTDPASSSNTALNSDLVTDGGTFVPASTIYTDIGTASDHLPVVADYTIASSTGTPTIGGFAASPTSVVSGASTTLTASSVTETGGTGTITGVNFYRESNGTTGLQIGSDTLVGAGTASGTSYSISASTSGLAAGSYTYYAVATDSNGHSSAVASTTLTVTAAAGTPTIGSFAANPASVSVGQSTTLTASSVVESGGTGTITGVNFYRESNGTSGLQIGSDTSVGSGTQSGTSWSITAATGGLAAGSYTYYAVATDSNGDSSTVATATLTITSSSSTPIHGTVLAWDMDGQTSYGTQGLKAGTIATGATNSTGLTRGSGVTTSGTAASNAWGGADWASTSATGISDNEDVTFGLTVSSGYSTSLSSIALNYRRSSTGPEDGYWQYQINGGTWGLISDVTNEFSSTSSSGAAMTPLSLTGISALQNLAAGTVVNFRLTPYGATSTAGTWYVYDGGNNTNDLVVTAS
jgi:endonuclease/exonuclease/phosphatase family metal-dependent hydrolase